VGGKKKVSALAGDLSSRLNMNALLAGGPVKGGGGGSGGAAIPRGRGPSSSAGPGAAAADPSRPTASSVTAGAKGDDGLVKSGEMHHPPRAMIPLGRRRRRGAR
jgi:hypothetical protein